MRAAVIGVMLLACSGKHPDAPAAPGLVVLDAGAAPRQRLRFDLAPRVERVRVTVKARLSNRFTNTVLAEGQRDADLPSIQFAFRVEAKGDGHVESVVEDVRVLDDATDPALRAATEREAVARRGVRGSFWRAANGSVTNVQRPGAASPAEHLVDLPPPFPDVPVGLGATWRVTWRYTRAKVTWTRTETLRVRAITDAAVTLDSTFVLEAGEHALAVEPRRTVTFVGGRAPGSASMVVPLHGIVPTGVLHVTGTERLREVSGSLRLLSTLATELDLQCERLPD